MHWWHLSATLLVFIAVLLLSFAVWMFLHHYYGIIFWISVALAAICSGMAWNDYRVNKIYQKLRKEVRE